MSRLPRQAAMIECSEEELLFRDFLKRQKLPPWRKPPSVADTRGVDTPALLRAISKVRRVASQFKSLFPAQLEALDTLELTLPGLLQRRRLGAAHIKDMRWFSKLSRTWRKSSRAEAGRPIEDIRPYFYMTALVPYATLRHKNEKWTWVEQQMDFLLAKDKRQNAAVFWRRFVAPLMTSKPDLYAYPILGAGACAHIIFSKCRARGLLPGTRLRGSRDILLGPAWTPRGEREILNLAVKLMDGLLYYPPHDPATIELVWQHRINWVA